MPRAFISVGSNINPAENVREALRLLASRTSIRGISTVYLTEAEGRPEQPRYYNCVVMIETETAPRELKFRVLRDIEEKLGRQRGGDKYAPRTIDLDLIVYDDLELETDELVLPDPQIVRRPFVAIPLFELAPELELPGIAPDRAKEMQPGDRMKPLSGYTKLLREETLGPWT